MLSVDQGRGVKGFKANDYYRYTHGSGGHLMATPRIFTDAQRDLLRRLWNEGVAVKLIAQAVGCTDKQVYHLRRNMNLTPRPYYNNSVNRTPGRALGRFTAGTSPNNGGTSGAVAHGRDEVVLFLQRCNVVVFSAGPGLWRLNYRDTVDRDGLLARANRHRELRGMEPFA